MSFHNLIRWCTQRSCFLIVSSKTSLKLKVNSSLSFLFPFCFVFVLSFFLSLGSEKK